MYQIHKEFRDGHTTYYAGERVSERNFTPAKLEDFRGYGWLSPLNAEPVEPPTGVESTLTIHDGYVGHVGHVGQL